MNPTAWVSARMRAWVAAFAVGVALFAPAREAQAMTAMEALDKVCSQMESACGKGLGYEKVVADCFVKSDDEGACALALMEVSGNASLENAAKGREVILSCINQPLPVNEPLCREGLKAAGLNPDQVNEAWAVVTVCTDTKNVDGAIMCADALLDSPFAEQLEINPPSWVDSLFDIYMDIRDKDWMSLIYHVGATVACAIGNYITGTDVCKLLETIADIGNFILDAINAVADFLTSLFGGDDCYKEGGKCQPLSQMVFTRLMTDPGRDPGVVARLASEVKWTELRKNALVALSQHPDFKKWGPNAADVEAGWNQYRDLVFAEWDKRVRELFSVRLGKIEAAMQKLSQEKFDDLVTIVDPDQRKNSMSGLASACNMASKTETDQILAWMKANRAQPKEGFTDPAAACAYRVVVRSIPTAGLHACTVNKNDADESVRATCATGRGLEVCKTAEEHFGTKRVQACYFGKGGETGVGQTTLYEFAQWLGKEKIRCTWGLTSKDINAMHCQDPASTAQCTKAMGEQYGNLGWPKAGVAECKLVPTAKRLKAVADAAKIAAAITTALNPPNRPTLKCGPDVFDAAVVWCENFVPEAAHLAKVKAKVPGITVRHCTPAEATTSATRPWMDEACVGKERLPDLSPNRDLTKPASPANVTNVKPGPNPAAGGGLGEMTGKSALKPGIGTGAVDKKPVKPSTNLPGK
jgi:hypothetical protein